MINFVPRDDCDYKHDYAKIFEDIAKGVLEEIPTYRQLILTDLFFMVYFVLELEAPDGSASANRPFIVNACKEIEEGPQDQTVDLWAREHYKSTILTTAEVIQKILKNPEERIGIFSHTRPVAKAFLRGIKSVLEGSDLLKKCFPDVMWEKPDVQAPKWSEDDGLVIKRKGYYREATVEAWGLVQGMPTGKHFTHRVYDDVETADVVENPATVKKLISRFDLSHNLGTDIGTMRVIGTYYSHAGLLTHLRDMKDPVTGEPVYYMRIKPGSHNGLPDGKPVLLSDAKWAKLRAGDQYNFFCQQLLNPTPQGFQRLNSSLLQEIDPEFIPKNLAKFQLVDPAGDDKDGTGDAWALGVFAVAPDKDEIGQSSVYITDLVIQPFGVSEAIEEIVRMYLRNGIIQQVGVEKIGISTIELHVQTALKAKGRHVSLENDTLVLLKPAGRNKIRRIESALAWPLNNSKIFISKAIKKEYRDRLIEEMDKFPYWHDDGLDILSYLYDVIHNYRFGCYWGAQNSEPIVYRNLGIV